MSLLLLAAYASGIVAAQYLAPWQWPMQWHAQVACAIVLIASWFVLHPRRYAWIPCFGLLCLCGQLNASLHLDPPAGQQHVAHFADNKYIAVEGRLTRIERRTPEGFRLLVDTHLVARDHQEAQVSGKVLLYVKHGEFSANPGQIIRWRSRLRRPNRFGNPGGFDYPLHLAAQGIYVTAFVKRAQDLVVIINHPLTHKDPLGNLRQKLAADIERSVPAQTAGLLQSLLLGKRDLVSPQQRELLAKSGVAHLFAISGLHFGLLAMFLYITGKWIYTRSEKLMLWQPPQRVLPLLLLIPLFAYMLLTGSAWGTRRAFLMVSFVALLLTLSRRTPPLALLATTAFTILLGNPLALFQPGFQLSFSGVAGILLWVPVWQHPFMSHHKILRVIILLCLTTAAATLATAPATLWHFHQFAPAGFLTNLVAIPLIAWGSVPLGLISLVLLPVSQPLADAGLQFSALLVDAALSISVSISQFPGFKVIPHYLTLTQLGILIGGLTILVPYKMARPLAIRVGLATATLIFCLLTYRHEEELRIIALSVGQGDATLVSYGDEHYLVDGGGMPDSGIDTGARIVAPALGRLGVKELAGVLLTHNHPDHGDGLAYILDRFTVKKFFSALSRDELPAHTRSVLNNNSTTTVMLEEGWTNVVQKPGQVLQFFTPDQKARDMNERSVAVYAGTDCTGCLLTADLGSQGFKQILAAGLPGKVGLLKLPHHGSRHARPDIYLDTLQPQLAFVSAGLNNVYGFPHHSSLEACKNWGIPLYRTDTNGILGFHIKEKRWHSKDKIN